MLEIFVRIHFKKLPRPHIHRDLISHTEQVA